MSLSFHVREQDVALAEKFYADYDLVGWIIPAESNKGELKPRSQRTCRFCGHSTPDVSFSSDAHLIPEFLGNKFIYSDSECDSCNQLFSEYEDQFAKMIGPYRTLHAMQGKGNKYPTFKSPSESVRMDVKDFYDNQTIQISRTESENKAISFDMDKGEIKVTFKKQPYSLQKVYKFFMKLALSVIPVDEVHRDYQFAKEYLLNTTKGVLSGCTVVSHTLQFPTKLKTHLFLFKKRDPNAKICTHAIALYTMNYVFALPITLNKNDFWFYNQDLPTFDYPLMSVQKINFSDMQCHTFREDFSSDEPIKEKEEEMRFSLRKEDIEKMEAVNLETGEKATDGEFGKSPIMKIILGIGDDMSVDLSKLKK